MRTSPIDKDARRNHLRKQAGVWLKQKREEAGLTQKDLAAVLDLKIYTFVAQIEQGKGRIPFERYGDWAKALRMDEYDFTVKALSYYEPSIFDIMVVGASRRSNSKF